MVWVVGALVVAGLVFFAGGTVGILRLPDFYTRLHAAGKLDTLGSLLVLGGLALAVAAKGWSVGSVLTGLKVLLIVAFVFIASPTSTHAIVDAGRRAGLKPWLKEEGE